MVSLDYHFTEDGKHIRTQKLELDSLIVIIVYNFYI